jgi:hypothetical protein
MLDSLKGLYYYCNRLGSQVHSPSNIIQGLKGFSLSNVRLGIKVLQRANTLAYLSRASMKLKKVLLN